VSSSQECASPSRLTRRATSPSTLGGMPALPPDGGTDARPGDGLVRAGVIAFAVGLVAALVTVLPLFLGTRPLPTAVYLVAVICCPAGLALGLGGLWRSGRARRRQAGADGHPPVAPPDTR
jgi:hypothetical protein